jgi:peptidoglycan endopeptidase LytF
MSKKNTILIAVMINASLLVVLLIAALSTQEEAMISNPPTTMLGEQMPKFDERSIFLEQVPIATFNEVQKFVDTAPKEPEEPFLLPPIVKEQVVSTPPQPSVVAVKEPLEKTNSLEVQVKKGDNLEKIAKAHHTTVDEIIKLNHLSNSFLKIGQVLKIPQGKSTANIAKQETKKSSDTSAEYYTMKVGENPWAIAMKHHMKVEELLRLNGLNDEKARKLKPGDRLRIR